MMTEAERTRVKDEQRDNWNAASAGWDAAQDDFERGARAVTERLVELAGVRRGQAVLDIATGHGEPALSVARTVGPEGLVVGVDIAADMLAIARRRATRSALEQVEFVEGDVDQLGQPAGRYDAVVSRFGVMFASDQVAAFRGIEEVLTPGGVFAAAVWAAPDRHLLSIGPSALSARLELPPPPDGPGQFAMADPVRLAQTLTAGGLIDVTVEELVVPFRFTGAGDYARFHLRALPPAMVRTASDRLGEAGVEQLLADAVGHLTAADGSIPVPSVALCVRAFRAA